MSPSSLDRERGLGDRDGQGPVRVTPAESDASPADGDHPGGIGRYVLESDFWSRTLQNWQSEFLAVGPWPY